jgi:lipopolysaccharide exporter
MNDSLKIRTFKNINYNVLSKIIALFFQAAANIVLTNYLFSGDYGIVGFAFIFTNFLGQFNNLGIDSAIIQKTELDERGLYTAFSIKTFLGIILFFITFLVAPIAPLLFDNSAVINVIRLSSLNFLINIFAFLPNSLLRRELDYRKISLASILSSVVGSLLAIFLAIHGFKYWSIVLSNLTSTLILVLIINFLKPVKIKAIFDMKLTKEFVNYGWKLFVSGMVVFAIFNLDNLLVGSVKGSSTLGFYVIAFDWGSMICTTLSAVVLTVLFPTFAKIQNDKDKLKATYLKTLEYISFVGILANITLFFISKEFLIYVLGHGTAKWLPALSTLRILCIYGILRVLLEPIGSVIMAIGRTELLLKSTIVAAIIQLALLYPVLVYFNIEGVAVLVTLSYASQYFIYFPCIRKDININSREIIITISPSIKTLPIFILMLIIFEKVSEPSLIMLIQKIILSIASYVIIYGLLTKWKLFKEVVGFIPKFKSSTYSK